MTLTDLCVAATEYVYIQIFEVCNFEDATNSVFLQLYFQGSPAF